MVEHQYLYIFGITIFIGMVFSLPIFKYLDDEVHAKRNTGMDGLRYFLASFVAIFHSDYFVRYITTGKWETIYNDISYIAQFAVSIFFMITAFLFWGKISKKEDVDWVNLYKDRLFRIAPATIFTALISIVI
ncbi:acyltransferase family protein, partial [Escherichia coli]|nr:acyltransferase family protein [Escherichia coli]